MCRIRQSHRPQLLQILPSLQSFGNEDSPPQSSKLRRDNEPWTFAPSAETNISGHRLSSFSGKPTDATKFVLFSGSLSATDARSSNRLKCGREKIWPRFWKP